jgi:hypothetical protein
VDWLEVAFDAELGEFAVQDLQGFGCCFGRVDISGVQEFVPHGRDVGTDLDQVALLRVDGSGSGMGSVSACHPARH